MIDVLIEKEQEAIRAALVLQDFCEEQRECIYCPFSYKAGGTQTSCTLAQEPWTYVDFAWNKKGCL